MEKGEKIDNEIRRQITEDKSEPIPTTDSPISAPEFANLLSGISAKKLVADLKEKKIIILDNDMD